MTDDVAAIRAFNRFYTQQVGLLDEHYASSPYSLTEGRVLYEVATRGHTSSSELTRALRLDAAYMSRIRHKLIAEGLLAISPGVDDRRSSQLALTPDGDGAFAKLDAASDSAVEQLLAPLDSVKRKTLVAAMQAIESLIGPPPSGGTIILRPHRIGELGWLIHRQGLLYNQQFGWNIEFEALIAKIYSEFETSPPSPPKALWVAERNGTIAGSIFVVPSEGRPGTAQLRMLYVEPDARGMGLGRTLVNQVVTFARQEGYKHVRLWTQSILDSARKVYAAAGFVKLDEEAHHSFGKDLVGEHWELALQLSVTPSPIEGEGRQGTTEGQ